MKDANAWLIAELFTAQGHKKEIINYLWRYMNEEEPAERLRLLAEGRDFALQHDEYWLALYMEHHHLQVLLGETGDFQTALDDAVRVTVEARKPMYDGHPQRLCVHEDLIWAYSEIDPAGNADLIENALNYIASHMDPDLQCYYCLQSLKTTFELGLGRLENALAATEHYLSISNAAEAKYEYERACLARCELCYLQKDFTDLLSWAIEAGRVAGEPGDSEAWIWEHYRMEQLAWQALAYLHQGNEDEAQKSYQRAMLKASHTKRILPDNYYTALCAYYEAKGELDKAIALRKHQYESLADKGRTFKEYRCLYELCRLLAKASQPMTEFLSQARLVAGRLKQPERYLAELKKIGTDTNP